MLKHLIFTMAFLAATTPAVSPSTTEVVSFDMVPTPAPTTPPQRDVHVNTYSLSHTDIDILAKLLWSSPLRDEQSKRDLLWVVFNRISDDTSLFGSSIDTVVITQEFSFYDRHAHVSEENTRIAVDELNRFYSELDGLYVGDHVTGLYIQFSGDRNRTITVLEERA